MKIKKTPFHFSPPYSPLTPCYFVSLRRGHGGLFHGSPFPISNHEDNEENDGVYCREISANATSKLPSSISSGGSGGGGSGSGGDGSAEGSRGYGRPPFSPEGDDYLDDMYEEDDEDDEDDVRSSRQDSFNSGSSISISINPNPSASQDDFEEEEEEDRGYVGVNHPHRNHRNPPSSTSGVIDPSGHTRSTTNTVPNATWTTASATMTAGGVNGGAVDATVSPMPRTSTIVNDQRHARKKVVFDYDIDIARL